MSDWTRRQMVVRAESEPFLTSAEVALLLKLARSTVEDYARRGVIPSVRIGRHRRFVWDDVHRAILSQAEGGPSPR